MYNFFNFFETEGKMDIGGADVITIQETKLTLKQTHPKYITSPPCVPIGCTRQGGGLIPLIRDNIVDIPSTINTHNTEIQMVKVDINNIKHITITNIYIHP